MDVPRWILLGAPFAATAALAVAAPGAEVVLASGLGLGLVLTAYAVLRLRGDLALPLAGVGLAHALVFVGMRARCAGEPCGELGFLWEAFHGGAFGAALAALSVLVAAVFARPLRPGWTRGAAAAALAALALVVDALAWGAR